MEYKEKNVWFWVYFGFLYVRWLVVRVEGEIEIWAVRMDFNIDVRVGRIIYSKYVWIYIDS